MNGGLPLHKSESSVALRKFVKRLLEVFFVKVRPEGRAEVELGIGYLVEEEIADTKLASRANEEVGIGYAVSGEIGSQRLVSR